MAQTSITIEIDGIGPMLFVKSKRHSRRLHIVVKSYKEVKISVPFGLSFHKAKDMVREKLDWIQKQLDRIKNIEKNHRLKLRDISHMPPEEKTKKIIDRTMFLANKHGFKIKKITVRKQKTIWGSCSVNNHISLNIKLVQLPEHLMDYVILHELVHTKIKDHSKNFWAEIDRLVLNFHVCKKQMKDYHLGLMGHG